MPVGNPQLRYYHEISILFEIYQLIAYKLNFHKESPASVRGPSSIASRTMSQITLYQQLVLEVGHQCSLTPEALYGIGTLCQRIKKARSRNCGGFCEVSRLLDHVVVHMTGCAKRLNQYLNHRSGCYRHPWCPFTLMEGGVRNCRWCNSMNQYFTIHDFRVQPHTVYQSIEEANRPKMMIDVKSYRTLTSGHIKKSRRGTRHECERATRSHKRQEPLKNIQGSHYVHSNLLIKRGDWIL